jgi:tetratricopeptide (TPR) repeat protein
MRLKTAFILFVSTVGILSLNAQGEKSMVRKGNNEYGDGNYSEAEVQYRKALTENPNSYKGKFNLGDAMYEQENYEESGKIYSELTEANLTPNQKAKVFYNQGNTLMKGQKYGEAVDAFKKSLRLNPDDFDAKYNLEYARKKLSEQQQQQQQNQDKDKDKDKQDKDKQDKKDQQDKQDQDKDKEQQDQDKQDQDKQDQNQDQKNDKSDQQKDQQQPQQISKQDAQRMLEALKNDEKETLQKLQKQKAKAAKGKKTEIDW